MPGPAITPFQSDTRLPKSADVVVIGGGIIGTSAALELAERGLSVVLCEKGEIGGEQSSRNWGWVRLAQRDPREIPLMIEAIRLWQGLDARIGRKTGYAQSGILFACPTEKALARDAAWARNLDSHDAQARIVRGAELDALLPEHRLRMRGALYTPGDGRAEPQWAAPAIAEGARDAGATVITRHAVRTLDIEGGRIAGVITERGRIACTRVVLAAGAWSRLFAGNAGIWLPQLKVQNTVLRTTAVEAGPEPALWTDRFAIRKRADGGYTIARGTQNTVDLVPDSLRLARAFLPAFAAEWRSLRFRLSDRWRIEAAMPRRWDGGDVTAFEEYRTLDPAPSTRSIDATWNAARAAFPQLDGARIMQSWAGMIDATPDALPVISAVEEVPGLIIGTGFSGHGFGIGPGAGRLLADLTTGDAPVVDPAAFRLSRFTDGSRIAPQSGF